MQALVLSGLTGWGCCCFWWWVLFGHGGPPGDYGLDWGPGLARGPLPDPWTPWWPLANGVAGALGGIAAWNYLGDRFGRDGSFGSVVLISIVGGLAATSLLNAVGALRKPRIVRGDQPKN